MPRPVRPRRGRAAWCAARHMHAEGGGVIDECGLGKPPDTPHGPAQPGQLSPHPAAPPSPPRAASPAVRMSRAQADSLVQSVKDWTLVASLTGLWSLVAW